MKHHRTEQARPTALLADGDPGPTPPTDASSTSGVREPVHYRVSNGQVTIIPNRIAGRDSGAAVSAGPNGDEHQSDS